MTKAKSETHSLNEEKGTHIKRGHWRTFGRKNVRSLNGSWYCDISVRGYSKFRKVMCPVTLNFAAHLLAGVLAETAKGQPVDYNIRISEIFRASFCACKST